MKYVDVFVGLGSNLGNRESFLASAVLMLQNHEQIYIVKESTVIETAPVGDIEQGAFLNQVLQVETELEPAVLLNSCLAIEESQGRVRGEKWGPRTLDIDILFYGNHVLDAPSLHVPHPELHLRQFVLGPLAEIAPEFEHPVCKKNMQELLETLLS